MSLESKLQGWTGPSSDTEQEMQERAERMVREAVEKHPAFAQCSIDVYAKGSYRNGTNVRSDSDVDIAVHCTECVYWTEAKPGAHPPSSGYSGDLTPDKLRSELVKALKAKFPTGSVDASGSTAIRVDANTVRVDADVVPCFSYRHYFSPTSWRDGTRVYKNDGSYLTNYPDQQLSRGDAKNKRTNGSYKGAVRIMKRVENAMVEGGIHREVQSYFVECLVYNVPDDILNRATWVATIKGILSHIFHKLEGAELDTDRWHEVNGIKYLFHKNQPWTRAEGRAFAKAAWNFLELKS